MSTKDKDKKSDKNNTNIEGNETKKKNATNENAGLIPVLPLRDIVIFPRMIAPLFVGRESSIKALKSVLDKKGDILLLTQKDSSLESPKKSDLYSYGTIGRAIQLINLPDGNVKVLVEGKVRAKVTDLKKENGYFVAKTVELKDSSSENPDVVKALVKTILAKFESYVKLMGRVPPDLLISIKEYTEPSRIGDVIASNLDLSIEEKQSILKESDIAKRLEFLITQMERRIGALEVERAIKSRVKKQVEKNQRDYYLNEQMKAIQKELGEYDDGQSEIDELEEKITKLKLSKEVRDKARSELKKLKMMSPMSAEAAVIRNYLDWILGIPWKKASKIKKDLDKAKEILDKDHYGLEKVKERILEYLAVQSRVGTVKGPILCLVGPPGVGKTSLGKSIAESTGRKFVRMALGGVRDEAEIRGHRRTYVGALPGKIIQGMKKAGTSNPLFLLDEIDKMSSDFRGDPSSAMLEVLDPEQNSHFNDHYLEVDYDLSDVMFVCTANEASQIPQPLMDRMEVIYLSSYTEGEKLQIAKLHLVKKQMELNGLKDSEWSITDGALRTLIRRYVREAGVRGLEREIANIMRKCLREILTSKSKSVKVTEKNLEKYAGVPRYSYGVAEEKDLVGVATGLAWTQYGGELLSIEAIQLPGSGKMKITGKLGDVMQESIQAAASYIKAKATSFGVAPTIFKKYDFHIHVPEGATPKDGPSAGVGMCTAIVSMLTKVPVRRDVAMTGEITLQGRVLAIGGLKEKLLAALRGCIKTVLIPKENEKDLAEIPDNVKSGLEIIPVSRVEEVLEHALVEKLEPIIWNDEQDVIIPCEEEGAETISKKGCC